MVPSRAAAPPKIYEREYYERLRELEERHWWAIGMRDIAGRLLAPHLGGGPVRVLDAGCGTGGMLSWLEGRTGSVKAVGIDVSPHALQFCLERRLSRLARASITQLPFPDGAFDLVICLDVIQHLPRDGADLVALRECHRVLRPGGILYLRTNVRLGCGAPPRDAAHDPGSPVPDFHQYTHQEMATVMRSAGFLLEKLTYANMLPSLVWTWMRRLNPGQPREQSDGHYHGLAMRVPPPWLGIPLRVVMYGEAAFLSGRGRALPSGHSLVCLGEKPTGVRTADPVRSHGAEGG